MITYYIHNPPDLLHAGGVAIYTRNTSTAFKRTDVNTTDEFETIWVEIVNTKANSYFLLPCISQPTRITERSATLIDNMFSNTYAMNAISSSLASKICDHLPQFLIVDNRKVNYKY